MPHFWRENGHWPFSEHLGGDPCAAAAPHAALNRSSALHPAEHAPREGVRGLQLAQGRVMGNNPG